MFFKCLKTVDTRKMLKNCLYFFVFKIKVILIHKKIPTIVPNRQKISEVVLPISGPLKNKYVKRITKKNVLENSRNIDHFWSN